MSYPEVAPALQPASSDVLMDLLSFINLQGEQMAASQFAILSRMTCMLLQVEQVAASQRGFQFIQQNAQPFGDVSTPVMISLRLRRYRFLASRKWRQLASHSIGISEASCGDNCLMVLSLPLG
ncbi:hypothetical protein Nepgr_009812 [Nepenthes gracilis]|uniref:Uncharacterized protein n=1 Tax=Nepenthes gracilis TaxID=150966 RepID=A0AAD3SBG3_NEPGR|nr:hypothetical protein Nepgr_009812 [Nepenthes gracilis]